MSDCGEPAGQLLPYLVNRGIQESQLRKAIVNHHDKQLPLLCFIHGNNNQSSDKFIERLEKHFLPTFEPQNTSVKRYFLNIEINHVAEINDELLDCLGAKILNLRPVTLDKIAQTIAQEPGPVLIETILYTSDWVNCEGIRLIEEFIKFWGDWPRLPAQNYLILICLRFCYLEIEKPTRWLRFLKPKSINQEIKQYFENLDNILESLQMNGVVLSELGSITLEQVEKWVENYLRECSDIIIPKIREWFSSPGHQIPMEQLALHLKQLLITSQTKPSGHFNHGFSLLHRQTTETTSCDSG